MKFYNLFLLICLSYTLTSCGAYEYSVLFKTKDMDLMNPNKPEVRTEFNKAYKAVETEAEKNYVIRKFDRIGFQIFTKSGELLSDPNGDFQVRPNPFQSMQMGTVSGIAGGGQGQGQGQLQGGQEQGQMGYLVNEDGTVFFPLLGSVMVEKMKMYQLDSLLSKKYETYYEGSFVQTRVINRRVVLIGALGSRIIPLLNEDMNLIEVLATAGNLDLNTRTDRIRIIRNPLKDPKMQFVDLTTFEGIRTSNLKIEPNDIIYLEPRRRVSRREGLSDISSIIGTVASIISSTATLVLLFKNLQ